MKCSFCHKSQTEVKQLISGLEEDSYICNECVGLCSDILDVAESPKIIGVYAADIKKCLDLHVVGQERTKMIISVAIEKHFTRLQHPVIDGVNIDKTNLLLVGPTGTGKSLIAETLASFLHVPLSISDATSLTESGYTGDDVSVIIRQLISKAGGDISLAENGIIFIDEIDKKTKKGEGSVNRDISGEGVQQSLLKMLEGDVITLPPESIGSDPIEINTANILFIVGGAFVGIDDIVSARMKKNTKFGFGSTPVEKEIVDHITANDLISFGIIPELVGRLPIIAPLYSLSLDELVEVLQSSKNSFLKQTEKLLALNNISLHVDDDALYAIAKKALLQQTGARGLRSIIESIMLGVNFKMQQLINDGLTKIQITKNDVENDTATTIFKEK